MSRSEAAAAENASSYFPLLDRIAEGVLDDAVTEKELYDRFLTIVQDEGHINDAADLSSFKFSLAIRSAVPRVEAHYQYYNTSVEPRLGTAQDAACPVWVHMDGMQYCSPTLERAQQAVSADLYVYDAVYEGSEELGLIVVPVKLAIYHLTENSGIQPHPWRFFTQMLRLRPLVNIIGS